MSPVRRLDRSPDFISGAATPRYLAVCLNPVIQNTLVFGALAKGEVNRTKEYRLDASGKGINTARILTQMGRDATHLTQLGGPTRDWFLAMCLADGLRVCWAESNSDIRICTTVIDRADGSATELVEEALPVGAGTAERLHELYGQELAGCDAVLFSGTSAAGFNDDMMPSMVRLAAEAGKKIFLDISGRALVASLPFRPIVAKPNLEELLRTYVSGRAATTRGDEDAVHHFVAGIGAEYAGKWGAHLVVTRGAKSTLYWDGKGLCECPVPRIEALNPIGSGDAFMAGLAASLTEGASLKEAVAEGTRLGVCNASLLKPGSIL
jgi:tagatose 6-phosphate kinase